MTDLYAYATLSPEPAESFDLHWLDDNSGADGSNHRIEYREKDSGDDWIEIQDISGQEMTASDGIYLYHVNIDGLNSNTEYGVRIYDEDDEYIEEEFETFPRRLHKRELFGISTQDCHIRRSMTGAWEDDKEKMDIISGENPEFVILPGDWLTNADDEDSDSADDFRDWIVNWLSRLDNNGKLVPVFYVPGNHETGNGDWTGTKDEDLSDNEQCNDFCLNKDLFEPDGEYYGQIKIGNYLNIIGLDTHSAYTEDQGKWLKDNIEKDIPINLIMYHNPIFVSGDRFDSNFDQGEVQAKYWMSPIYDAENIWAGFSGNIHVRKVTNPLKVSDDASGDSFETDDGRYVVEADDGERAFIEFGEGWTADKDTVDDWYVDRTESGEEHYYRIWIRNDGHEVEDVALNADNEKFEFPVKKTRFQKNKALLAIGGI